MKIFPPLHLSQFNIIFRKIFLRETKSLVSEIKHTIHLCVFFVLLFCTNFRLKNSTKKKMFESIKLLEHKTDL